MNISVYLIIYLVNDIQWALLESPCSLLSSGTILLTLAFLHTILYN